jgi:cell division protein ZapA
MSTIAVLIAGKNYRVACGDGEEEHLTHLASLYDEKIEEMRRAFGEIGDMRLHVMAALTLADELMEAKAKAETLEQQLNATKAQLQSSDEHLHNQEIRLVETLSETAARIERLAKSLSTPPSGSA